VLSLGSSSGASGEETVAVNQKSALACTTVKMRDGGELLVIVHVIVFSPFSLIGGLQAHPISISGLANVPEAESSTMSSGADFPVKTITLRPPVSCHKGGPRSGNVGLSAFNEIETVGGEGGGAGTVVEVDSAGVGFGLRKGEPVPAAVGVGLNGIGVTRSGMGNVGTLGFGGTSAAGAPGEAGRWCFAFGPAVGEFSPAVPLPVWILVTAPRSSAAVRFGPPWSANAPTATTASAAAAIAVVAARCDLAKCRSRPINETAADVAPATGIAAR